MKRTLLTPLLSIALCAVCAAPVLAQGLPGAAVRPDAKSGASADRDAAKARTQERCKDNPQQCEEAKAKFKARQEQCKADPEKCQAERKARFEERCKRDPQRCEEVKARARQRQEECKADPAKCPAGRGEPPRK